MRRPPTFVPIEANPQLSGIFNVASGNYTVGEVGDLVEPPIEERLGLRPKVAHPAHSGFPQLQGEHGESAETS